MAAKTRKKYGYRYLTDGGKPLTNCPGCNHDLTAHNEVGDCFGVEIEYTTGKRNWTDKSYIDPTTGALHDPNDQVACGNHSHTSCNYCGEMLANLDGVNEVQAT